MDWTNRPSHAGLRVLVSGRFLTTDRDRSPDITPPDITSPDITPLLDKEKTQKSYFDTNNNTHALNSDYVDSLPQIPDYSEGILKPNL